MPATLPLQTDLVHYMRFDASLSFWCFVKSRMHFLFYDWSFTLIRVFPYKFYVFFLSTWPSIPNFMLIYIHIYEKGTFYCSIVMKQWNKRTIGFFQYIYLISISPVCVIEMVLHTKFRAPMSMGKVLSIVSLL